VAAVSYPLLQGIFPSVINLFFWFLEGKQIFVETKICFSSGPKIGRLFLRGKYSNFVNHIFQFSFSTNYL